MRNGGRIVVGTASWIPTLLRLAEEAEVVHAVFRNAHRDFAPRSAERRRHLLAAAGDRSSRS